MPPPLRARLFTPRGTAVDLHSTTHTGLSYAYDAEGIRTGKSCTVETWEAIPQYTVTFVADGTTVKTMTVDDGYVLQNSDYPTVPPKTGYTGTWNRYTSAIHSNITIQATYTVVATYTVTFVARGLTVKTMTVNDGYVLKSSDYPAVPPRRGYAGRWNRYTSPIHSNITITAIYTQDGGIEIPIDPVDPPVVDYSLPRDGGGAASVEEQEAPAEVQETAELSGDRTGQRLVSTQTVQHDYLTLSGRVARETITTDGTVTAVLDFIYDSQGRPFALNYSANGGNSFTTYYYVLNLQGDVVKLISYIPGFEYEEVASYTYDAWGNIISATGEKAELNPLRYRGYYYDSETGFYYLQSRYYDPANHRFINADVYTSTDSSDAIACNMFAYCGNNPVRRVDAGGNWWLEDGWNWVCGAAEDAWDWVCKAASDVADGVAVVWDKAKAVAQSVYNNLELSVGIGGGLYREFSAFEAIGVGMGGYVNYATVHLKNGTISCNNEMYAGATATYSFLEFGACTQQFKKGNGPITDEGFVGINSKKESVTLFSAKAYVLYIGFSVEIGFNFSGFFKDLAEIF